MIEHKGKKSHIASPRDIDIVLGCIGVMTCLHALKYFIRNGISWANGVFLLSGLALILVAMGVIKESYIIKCRMALVLFESSSVICTITVVAIIAVASMGGKQPVLLHSFVILIGIIFSIVLYKIYKYYIRLGSEQV